MANISRPFQVALAGVVVLAAVWLLALRGHNNSAESSSSAPAASAPAAAASTTPAAEEKAAAAKTPTYHGSAPGVQGLSSAIAKAHGAVAASQANAHQLESKSAQASSTGGAAAASAPSTPSASAPAASATAATAAGSKAAGTSHATHPASLLSAPARQRAVEKAIARGDVTLILFWDRRGADDRADAKAVRAAAGGRSHVSVQMASSKEVAEFGTITRGVQVYGTPTVLVVGKSGHAIVLTGLTDRFALAQAIAEARHA